MLGKSMTSARDNKREQNWWCIALLSGFMIGASSHLGYASPSEEEPLTSPDSESAVSKPEQSTAEYFWQQTSIVPIVLYSPETSLMMGAGTLTIINPKVVHPNRPSSVSLFGMYTLKQQAVLAAAYEYRSLADRHVVQQIFRYVDWPDQFYGIGNGLKKGINIEDANGDGRNYIRLTDRYLQLETEYLHQPLRHLYVGLGHHWRNSRTPNIEDEAEAFNFSSYRGVGNLTWSGLLPIIAYDSRDRLLWPSRGLFIRGDGTLYRSFLGSDFNADLYRLDARGYARVSTNHILAFRMVYQSALGEVPFQRLPALGGSDLFRGWYLGRLRDRVLQCNELESRHEIGSNMAVVGFGAVGRVASRPSNLTADGYRVAGGAGFRYALNEEQRAHLRLDVAYGASLEVYFQFREAF